MVPPPPADSQPPSQGLLTKLRSRHPQTRQEHPWGSKPQSRGAPGHLPQDKPSPRLLPSVPLPPGFCFLLADRVLQSTDALSGFPVCL